MSNHSNILRKVLIMKATDLRLGNIVSVIDEPLKPDTVIILEPGIVHLMNRSEADDENNIVGTPMHQDVLASFNIPCNSWFPLGNHQVRVETQDQSGSVRVHCMGTTLELHYMHELQNLLHAMCGEDIIKHPHVHLMNETESL